MHPLLQDIFPISDNEALFNHLASGELLEDVPAPRQPKTRRAALLVNIGLALVESIRSGDVAPLDSLLKAASINDRIVAVGEIVMTDFALRERGEESALVNAMTNLAFEQVNECGQFVETTAQDDATDEELEIHAMALREWAHLLALHYESVDDSKQFAQMMFVRAKITNAAASQSPHLVGDGMVTFARAAYPIGQTDLALQCLNGVQLDLQMYADRIDDPELPRYEVKAATYWLEQAYHELCGQHPEDEEAKQRLQAVVKLREDRSLPPIPSTPQLGPIVRTYLDRIPWLSMVIKDVHTSQLESDDELIAEICQRYGVISWDVEFYISAIGSYHAHKLLAGMQMTYDQAHEEVFAAIEYEG